MAAASSGLHPFGGPAAGAGDTPLMPPFAGSILQSNPMILPWSTGAFATCATPLRTPTGPDNFVMVRLPTSYRRWSCPVRANQPAMRVRACPLNLGIVVEAEATRPGWVAVSPRSDRYHAKLRATSVTPRIVHKRFMTLPAARVAAGWRRCGVRLDDE